LNRALYDKCLKKKGLGKVKVFLISMVAPEFAEGVLIIDVYAFFNYVEVGGFQKAG